MSSQDIGYVLVGHRGILFSVSKIYPVYSAILSGLSLKNLLFHSLLSKTLIKILAFSKMVIAFSWFFLFNQVASRILFIEE